MNAKEKEVFRKLHDELSGCDPKYFVAKLIQSGILSQEDYEVYLQRSTPREKMNEICQIIQRKGILHPFMKALDETGDYDFIVDKYKKLTSQLGITCEDKLSVDDNEEILSGVLRLGGVPNLPAKLLPRQNEVFKVQGGILGMHDDDAILPVYCMAGGGKSVIVNQALRSQKLFNKIFNQGVYWVTVGKIEPDALLTKMQQLCVRMNVDKQPSSCEIAMEYLRKAFNRPEHRQTLVILDDVWSSDILRYFDVGCRLIVITKDLSVVDPFTRRNEPIEVNPFLTEAESIELFSLHLGIPIMEPDLSKAKDIHKEACGSPMMIYMIGDLLAKSRNRKSGADNWSKYAKALADRKQLSVKHTTDYQFSNPLDAIAMSFETLPREDQERFRWFAVFMRDVNIPAKVLATLWDIDTIDVEDYMYIYIKSTIAREMWDQATEQFIYGIHDFVLEYLKREVPTEEVKVSQRSIVDLVRSDISVMYHFSSSTFCGRDSLRNMKNHPFDLNLKAIVSTHVFQR
ncbi:hypothetical protein QYM36_010146 [Artemia franciscana]|uniref:CARD domain-containing protein n=1 Tax=Artemia franciscana TaxID=6661 RepID=A0AA88HQU6_ARTSF|nr:hypothetical protein QYM36_010146 [Artemia franciscana]